MNLFLQNYSESQLIGQMALQRLNDENFEGQAMKLDELKQSVQEMREEQQAQILQVNNTLIDLRSELQAARMVPPQNTTDPVQELKSEVTDLKRIVLLLLERPCPGPSTPGPRVRNQPTTSTPPRARSTRANVQPTQGSSNATGVVTAPLSPTSPGDMLAITSNAMLKGTYEHPVNACKDLPDDYPSGDYFILNNCNKTPVKVYCDMTRTACNSTGGWAKIAFLDMTNSSHECPESLTLISRDTEPHRLCGSKGAVCHSTIFKAHGISYSRVCGQVKGYQKGKPYAFYSQAEGIEKNYVHGVSLTYGNPGARKHIWSFVAGADETSAGSWNCPCTRTDLTWGGTLPSFIGQNYFCDTANHYQGYSTSAGVEFYDDALWDGDGCVAPTSTCCCSNNPPLFCAELPEPTNYDVELRLCNPHSISASDTPIEFVELYIK